jgi:hypothetical protein
MIGWLREHILPKKNDANEERTLQREVAVERARFEEKNRRATKVLDEFHRADAVLFGVKRGNNGS